MCSSVRGTRLELEFALAAFAQHAPDFASTSNTKRFFYAEIAIWTPIWQSWSAPSTSKVDPRALGMVIFRTCDGEHDSDAEFGAKIAILVPTLWARGLPD